MNTRLSREELVKQLSKANKKTEILMTTMKQIEEGCSFPDNEVERAVRNVARVAIAEVFEIDTGNIQ